MLAAVEVVKRELENTRTPDFFSTMFLNVNRTVEKLNLEPITLPRIRRPPIRFTGSAGAFQAESVEEHYRLEFFKLVNCTCVQLSERFSADMSGLQRHILQGKCY